MEQKIHHAKWILALALASFLTPARPWAQTALLSLEQAFEVAARNYPMLKRDRQLIEQQNALIRSAGSLPYTGIFIAADEASLTNTQGIHSLGLRQDFNWPGSKKHRAEAIRQQALLGNAQLELTQLELRRNVAQAYYEVLYTRQMEEFRREQVELFTELVNLAELRFGLGETGKIPVISAEGKQKEARLKQLQARQDHATALTIFNNWMYSDTAYDAAGRSLPEPAGYFSWFVNNGHPLLLFQQQQARLAEARVEVEKSLLLPQVRTGGALQMVDGDSPFFAYQLGLNFPLGQRAIRARIEGAKVEAELRETELDAARQELDNERRRLISALEKEQLSLDYIRKEMLPLAKEQLEDSRKAYAQGAVEYQDYLRNLEQSLDTRLQYLLALRRYNLLKLELEFLSGRR